MNTNNITLSSTDISREELAKIYRALSLRDEARAKRAIEKEKEEFEADFQEAIRLLREDESPNDRQASTADTAVDYSTIPVRERSFVPNPLVQLSSRHVNNKVSTRDKNDAGNNLIRSDNGREPAHEQSIESFFDNCTDNDQVESHLNQNNNNSSDGHSNDDSNQSSPAATNLYTENQDDDDTESHGIRSENDSHTDSGKPDHQQLPIEESLFVNKWAQNSFFDRAVLSFPQLYPDGDICYEIPKVEGKETKPPRIAWAHITNNKKSYCESVWVCKHHKCFEGPNGCNFRERPRAARRGKNTTNGRPPPKTKCPIHKIPPMERWPCKCWWTVDGNSKPDKWVVTHHGSHDHPAPQSAGASDVALEKVAKIIERNPNITASELAVGRCGKFDMTPLAEIDPRFHHRDYIAYIKRTILQAYNKKMTGSKMGPESLDGSFFYFANFSERKKSYVMKSELAPSQYIVIASEQMQNLLKYCPNPFQTDTLEGFIESVYFPGQMNVTMTSTWCPIRQTQIPVLITILVNKTTSSYKIHWDYFFRLYGEERSTLDDFFDEFPGNTSDFSDNIRQGFFLALDEFCEKKYKATLPPDKRELIYRYCEVHFKRNLNRTSNISKAVDPAKKSYFKSEVLKLLTIESYSVFAEQYRKLLAEFTLLASWFLWYLQDNRCKILFPACKSLAGINLTKFNKLKKDTNAQEGLGGFLQALNKYRSLGLYHCLNTIFAQISLFDREMEWRFEGIECKWTRTSKEDKKKAREPEEQYKAPESEKRLFRHRIETERRKKSSATTASTIILPGPVPLRNVNSCCFGNALVQNLLACGPIRRAITRKDLQLHDSFAGEEHAPRVRAFQLLQDLLTKLEHLRRIDNTRDQVYPTELLQIIQLFGDDHSVDRNNNLIQRDPIELFEWILNQLRDSGNQDHPLLTRVCTMGRLVSTKWCNSCQDGWADGQFIRKDVEENVKYHLTVAHTSAGCNLDNCLDAFFAEMPSEVNFKSDRYNHSCYVPEPVEQSRICRFTVDEGDSDEKVLIIQLSPNAIISDQTINAKERFLNSELGEEDIAKPKLVLHLGDYIDGPRNDIEKNESDEISGLLTGYISRIVGASVDTGDSRGQATSGHFVSVTLCSESDDYYLTDDLKRGTPKNIGHTPDDSWPSPYILFYRVQKISKLYEKESKKKKKKSKPNAVPSTAANNTRRVKTEKPNEANAGPEKVALPSTVANASVTKEKKAKKVKKLGGSQAATKDTGFKLPFLPALTQNDIKEADMLRGLHHKPENSRMTDVWIDIPPIRQYVGAPIYRMIQHGEGAIEKSVELFEGDYEKMGLASDGKGGNRGTPVSFEGLGRLADGALVDDEVVNAFAVYFNRREVMKKERSNTYRPAHMFSVNFITELCFEGGPSGRRKFQVDACNRWMRKTRVPLKTAKSSRPERARPEKGAMDIFGCSRLIFPMNEGQQHWIFFSVNPASLRQQVLDSMHYSFSDERRYVSECLYKWILYEHHIRHGKSHPQASTKWTPDHVLSDPYVLNNSHQAGMDCGLHTCVVPVLLQDGRRLGVFGESNEERVLAGIEMRRRMALMFARGEFMFATLESEVSRAGVLHLDDSSDDDSINDTGDTRKEEKNDQKRKRAKLDKKSRKSAKLTKTRTNAKGGKRIAGHGGSPDTIIDLIKETSVQVKKNREEEKKRKREAREEKEKKKGAKIEASAGKIKKRRRTAD